MINGSYSFAYSDPPPSVTSSQARQSSGPCPIISFASRVFYPAFFFSFEPPPFFLPLLVCAALVDVPLAREGMVLVTFKHRLSNVSHDYHIWWKHEDRVTNKFDLIGIKILRWIEDELESDKQLLLSTC